jgi:phosphoribosylanthranilate isomerase
MKIKICGLTRETDVRDATEVGATLVGFVFAEGGPRQVTPARARELLFWVPTGVARVGVFANEKPDIVRRIMEYCELDYVQLHGDETPEYCARFPRERVIKAFRVGPGRPLPFDAYESVAGLFLLDTYRNGSPGGTGKTFEWNDAKEAVRGRRILLSGGLSPENVEEAVRTLCPEGVDASSSLETEPGVKDPQRVFEFVTKARRALHAAR